MCLDTIDRKPEQVTEGWKIFRIIDDKIYGSHIPYMFKLNEWNKDIVNNRFIGYNNENMYQTGFHFYFKKKDAKKEAIVWKRKVERFYPIKTEYVIFKIKVKNVVTTGYKNGNKVGVVEEIFIGGKVCI